MEPKAVEIGPPEWPTWVGGGAGAAALAWVARLLWFADRSRKRVDGAEESVSNAYRAILSDATQAIEAHARDRAEWREERADLIRKVAECEEKHEACELRITELEQRK